MTDTHLASGFLHAYSIAGRRLKPTEVHSQNSSQLHYESHQAASCELLQVLADHMWVQHTDACRCKTQTHVDSETQRHAAGECCTSYKPTFMYVKKVSLEHD